MWHCQRVLAADADILTTRLIINSAYRLLARSAVLLGRLRCCRIIMPSTRTPPYVANTHDRSTSQATVPLSPRVSYMPAPTRLNNAETASPYLRIRLRASEYAKRAREVAESNIGLMLVAASQLFFSLMNVGVKKLNSLDPPVHAVEVSRRLSSMKRGRHGEVLTAPTSLSW